MSRGLFHSFDDEQMPMLQRTSSCAAGICVRAVKIWWCISIPWHSHRRKAASGSRERNTWKFSPLKKDLILKPAEPPHQLYYWWQFCYWVHCLHTKPSWFLGSLICLYAQIYGKKTQWPSTKRNMTWDPFRGSDLQKTLSGWVWWWMISFKNTWTMKQNMFFRCLGDETLPRYVGIMLVNHN